MKRLIFLVFAVWAGAAAYADNASAFKDWQEGRREEALAEWRRLAEAGDSVAQYNLAARYLSGDGVPQSRSTALDWLRRSAEAGSLRSMELLGTLLMSSSGFTPQYPEALHWLNLAAEAGSALAANNLAVFYLQGEGAPVDLARAHRFALQAAKGGIDNRVMLAEIETRLAPPAPTPPPVKQAALKPTPAPTPTVKSSWLIHIASVNNKGDAEGEWKRWQKLVPQLKDFEPVYADVTLAAGNQVTRIFVSGFADRDTAKTFCDAVMPAKHCFVTSNPQFR
jgi:hypothetical protein